MLNKKRKSTFYKEIQRRFGIDTFAMRNFMDGKTKMRLTKEELEKYYTITMDEFAVEAQMAGFKTIIGYSNDKKYIEDLIIFR